MPTLPRFTFASFALAFCLGGCFLSSAQGKDEPVSFQNDVLPIFMRAGCNAGDCHGAARGKDGFMLSLFGYDPEGDYYRLM